MIGLVVLAGAAVGLGYTGLVTGACPVDIGVGRRVRPLGPQVLHIAASREVVFDILAAPYLKRTPRAMAGKLHVLERGSDMVLAAHHTRVHARLTATTVETVRFDRPGRVDFRLVRGPVPHIVESFTLAHVDNGTRLVYEGEMGADFWRVGEYWASLVARQWEGVVAHHLASVKEEAERRSGSARR